MKRRLLMLRARTMPFSDRPSLHSNEYRYISPVELPEAPDMKQSTRPDMKQSVQGC